MDLVESNLEVGHIDELPPPTQQGEQLSNTMDRLRTLQAHDLALPTEILMHIFILCSSHTRGYLGCSPYDRPFAWTLSAVCHRWREVSLSLPRLWCRFSINLYRSTCGSVFEMVKTHLVRSGQSPLELKFYGAWPTTEMQRSIIRTVLNPIIKHSDRWHTVAFSNTCLFRAICSEGSLPALWKLELCFTNKVYGINNPFQRATCLTTVHLSGRIDTPDLIWSLSLCPYLECLSMDLTPYRCETVIPPNQLQLSRLRILRLCSDLCYDVFVHTLTTPNLEVLVIERLHPFVEGCISVLKKTPKLTHFWVSAVHFISWLHALDLRHHPNICHGLRQVGVFGGDVIEAFERAAALASLKGMIQARLGTLKSVALDSWVYRACLDWIFEPPFVGLDFREANMSGIRDQYGFT